MALQVGRDYMAWILCNSDWLQTRSPPHRDNTAKTTTRIMRSFANVEPRHRQNRSSKLPDNYCSLQHPTDTHAPAGHVSPNSADLKRLAKFGRFRRTSGELWPTSSKFGHVRTTGILLFFEAAFQHATWHLATGRPKPRACLQSSPWRVRTSSASRPRRDLRQLLQSTVQPLSLWTHCSQEAGGDQ